MQTSHLEWLQRQPQVSASSFLHGLSINGGASDRLAFGIFTASDFRHSYRSTHHLWWPVRINPGSPVWPTENRRYEKPFLRKTDRHDSESIVEDSLVATLWLRMNKRDFQFANTFLLLVLELGQVPYQKPRMCLTSNSDGQIESQVI